jgi:hypothetical protein
MISAGHPQVTAIRFHNSKVKRYFRRGNLKHTRTALRAATALLGLLLSAILDTAAAATPAHIVKADLKPLIRAAAESPTQFAVLVPYAVSTANAGTWSTVAGRSTWRYVVRVPTAVSLSFHALHASLPGSAVLTVRGLATTAVYHGKDLHNSELWSRIQPGDTLEFSLAVSTAERTATHLEIISLQAGYRALGAGVEDHPYYRQLRQQLAATTNTSCVQNYKCFVTPANTPAGQATVGLVIGNLYVCSGTLINDIARDNAPYVLTARHCETGALGGGNPGAALSMIVYWDATTACGSPLGSFYDPGVSTQTGATTVVEQQDAWLVRLDDSPVVTDAQLAGFDATGSAVQGGYTIHHALGFDKQFTTWFGTAYAAQDSGVLGVTYVSNFWETVNASGNIGPGSSGSGLFNQNNVLVGSATLGRQDGDSSGYQSCPIPNPSAPNGSNGAADFTQLSAVWNSTADNTSSTLPATLKSVLDPTNTGVQVASSMSAASMTFSASTYSLAVQGSVLLKWNAPGATQCTAGGGAAGDGWQGTLAGSGSQQVSEASASILLYTLTCQLPGARTVSSSVSITWGSPQPQVNFTGSVAAWTTTPATLTWTSNVSPCSIIGGSLSIANLPSSGSITTTQATTGDVSYAIQCGSPTTYITSSWGVSYVTPSLQFTANGTDRQLGQPFSLTWITAAQTCAPSGGAPNDGWTSTAFNNPLFNTGFSPNVTQVGTYTYTLNCTAGALSIIKSVTVTFETNPGYATLSVAPTTVTYSNTPADNITLTWNSNLAACVPASQPLSGGFISNLLPQDTALWGPPAPGTYVFTVTCNPFDTVVGSATSNPVTVTVLPPPPPTATMSISPSSVQVGHNFIVTWSSTYATGCAGTGTAPAGFLWPTTQGSLGTADSMTGNSQSAGQYTFGVTCQGLATGSANATALATLTITSPPPTTTLSASSTSLQTGQSLTLTWSSTNATSCSASGAGVNGMPWSGNPGTSGSVTQTATTPGSFTYTITCIEGNQSAKAQATVTVSAAVAAQKSTGGGGGGAASILELLSLAAALGLKQETRRRRVTRERTKGGRPAQPCESLSRALHQGVSRVEHPKTPESFCSEGPGARNIWSIGANSLNTSAGRQPLARR